MIVAAICTWCVVHQDALAHPYLADYHYPDDEPTAPRLADLGFEKVAMSKQELQIRMIRCELAASCAGTVLCDGATVFFLLLLFDWWFLPVWCGRREMEFFHPSSEVAPTPSARLQETANKNNATTGVVSAGVASQSMPQGTDVLVSFRCLGVVPCCRVVVLWRIGRWCIAASGFASTPVAPFR